MPILQRAIIVVEIKCMHMQSHAAPCSWNLRLGITRITSVISIIIDETYTNDPCMEDKPVAQLSSDGVERWINFSIRDVTFCIVGNKQ